MRLPTTLGVAMASLLLATSCSDNGDASDDSGADGGDTSGESSTASGSEGSEGSKESDDDGGDDGSADSGDSNTPDEEEEKAEKVEKKEAKAREKIRDAARAYSDAFLTGDSAAAFDRLSARCQEKVRNTFGTTVLEAETAYGKPLRFESFEAEVDGDSASATYTFSTSELDKRDEPWVLEDLWWKLDDCPAGDTEQK